MHKGSTAKNRRPDRTVSTTGVNEDDLLTGVAASDYLNISRTTLKKLTVKGQCRTTTTEDGRTVYRVRDLNDAKPWVGAYRGKRGKPSGAQRAFNANADKEAIAEKKIALSKVKGKLLTDKIVRTEAEIDKNREGLLTRLRDQVVHMAAETDIVAQLYAMLESPIEATRTKGLTMINEIVFKKTKEEEKSKLPWEDQFVILDDIVKQIDAEHSILAKVTFDHSDIKPIEV